MAMRNDNNNADLGMAAAATHPFALEEWVRDEQQEQTATPEAGQKECTNELIQRLGAAFQDVSLLWGLCHFNCTCKRHIGRMSPGQKCICWLERTCFCSRHAKMNSMVIQISFCKALLLNVQTKTATKDI